MTLCDMCLAQLLDGQKTEFVWGQGGSDPLSRIECCQRCAVTLTEKMKQTIAVHRSGTDIRLAAGLTPQQAAKVEAYYKR